MNFFYKKILSDGFVKGEISLIETKDLDRFSHLIYNLRVEQLKKNKKSPFLKLVGRNQELDLLLEKLISNKYVQDALNVLVGKDYLMMAPTARFSSPGDKGLELHQDAIGETGLLFLVTNSKTLILVEANTGASELENKYGRALCFNISTIFLDPETKPPLAPPNALPKVLVKISTLPKTSQYSGVPMPFRKPSRLPLSIDCLVSSGVRNLNPPIVSFISANFISASLAITFKSDLPAAYLAFAS